MVRDVCVLLLLGAMAVLLSPARSKSLPCPSSTPTNTSVEKILGDWYLHEMHVSTRVPQVNLCYNVEIADLQTTTAGKNSFSILLYKIKDGSQRKYSYNKTLEDSSDCPGHWITKAKDGYCTLVARSDDGKLVALAAPASDETLSTFILSRGENPTDSEVENLKLRMSNAHAAPQGHTIKRNGTLC